jgi:hypothetical protein
MRGNFNDWRRLQERTKNITRTKLVIIDAEKWRPKQDTLDPSPSITGSLSMVM